MTPMQKLMEMVNKTKRVEIKDEFRLTPWGHRTAGEKTENARLKPIIGLLLKRDQILSNNLEYAISRLENCSIGGHLPRDLRDAQAEANRLLEAFVNAKERE